MSALGIFQSSVRAARVAGGGYFEGRAPDPAIPNSPDGRFRILNEPAVGRIVVYERSSMIAVANTLSATDGTWHIGYLNPDLYYAVIGWDGTGVQSAAIQDWVKPALPE